MLRCASLLALLPLGVSPAEVPVPLVRWERTLADAELLSRASGRPLLVCVNMDGEPASEAFATRYYCDPDFAARTAAYVPVIACPDRHNPFDYDERGRRIECPRFGRVTCGEHIAIEPLVYERFFSGRRYAPRHVGISPAGEVIFDLYLLRDLSLVERTLAEHAPATTRPILPELLAERSADGRAARERAYLAAGARERARLLMAAARSDAEPYDLVRLGLAEDDRDLARYAVLALAGCVRADGLELLLTVRAGVLAGDARRLLDEALHRLASHSPRARAIERLEAGLAAREGAPDLESWRRRLAVAAPVVATAPERDLDRLTERLDVLSALEELRPDDAALPLEQARVALALAEALRADAQDPTFTLEDAVRFALGARDRGANAAEALALVVHARWLAGDAAGAAEAAREALPGWLARADAPRAAGLLEVLARSRAKQLFALSSPGSEERHGAWLGQADTAYALLLAHPLGTADHAREHVDLLGWLQLFPRCGEVLREALRRFPTSAELHARFRRHIETIAGPFALGRAYDRAEDEHTDLAGWAWFAGYAYLVEAEQRIRALDEDGAALAWRTAIERFVESENLEPGYADTARHYTAMAHAGLARLALHRDRPSVEAAKEIAAALETRPACVEWADGLGRTPLETLRLVRGALLGAGEQAALERLAERVRAIDAALWDRASPLERPPRGPLEAARRARLRWARLAGRLDGDADGRIERGEWRSDPEAFAALDVDGDGFLTLTDLLQGAR